MGPGSSSTRSNIWKIWHAVWSRLCRISENGPGKKKKKKREGGEGEEKGTRRKNKFIERLRWREEVISLKNAMDDGEGERMNIESD